MEKILNILRKVTDPLRRSDWKGYKLRRKILFLPLFTINPVFAWKNYPDDFYRSFEIDRNYFCDDKNVMNEIIMLKYGRKDMRVLMSIREMVNLHNLVKKATELEGDMAEVGVYHGGSAILICRANGGRPLHLFDTFDGLPDPDEAIDSNALKGGAMGDTSLEFVKNNLREFKNIHFYKGYFPETAVPVADKKFCFVHNDTDLYESTLAFLKFFYPRMVTGGIILTHDYNETRTPGVRKAWLEFFEDKPEFINELWDTQAYVVKIK